MIYLQTGVAVLTTTLVPEAWNLKQICELRLTLPEGLAMQIRCQALCASSIGQEWSLVPFRDSPQGPRTQCVRPLFPKTIKSMVFGTGVLRYWVLGPSGHTARSRLGITRP